MSQRIERIRAAVEQSHGCKAVHVASVPVREAFQGQTVWEGVVEVFDLEEHEKAPRCYAWSYQQGSETHYTTVLEIPPVASPRSAVQVAIAAQARARPD